VARRKPSRISTGRLQLLRLFSTLLAIAHVCAFPSPVERTKGGVQQFNECWVVGLEAKDTCQSNRQNLLTAAFQLTQNLAVFTQEFQDWFSIGPHCEVDPHPTILIAQF